MEAQKIREIIPRNRDVTYPLPWDTAQFLIARARREFEEGGSRLPLLIFAVGFYMGFRWVESSRFRYKDFDLGFVSKRERKTGKYRRVPVHPDLAGIVEFVRARTKAKPNDLLFGEYHNNRGKQVAITNHGANFILRRYFKDYRIDGVPSTHTLRKTFAMRVWDKLGRTDEGLVVVSTMLNHASTETTRTYLGISFGGKNIANLYRTI